MVRVIVGRPTGFCSGVERAIRLARKGRAQFGPVWTLGELVHNPLVLATLAQEGIRTARSVREVRTGALVISAHGCPPRVLADCRRLGIQTIDATCPYVRKVQTVAQRLTEQGYTVVVVGDARHPEVQGILAYSGPGARVYSPRGHGPAERIGVVAQTTMAPERFHEAVANLARVGYTELRVFDTICEEVKARQRAAARIAHQADLVIVVGGRNSANTSRLAEIARAAGPRVVWVERGTELKRSLLRGSRVIGIVAGSSTPSPVVKEILDIVRNRGGTGCRRL